MYIFPLSSCTEHPLSTRGSKGLNGCAAMAWVHLGSLQDVVILEVPLREPWS